VIYLDDRMADRLATMGGPGESYSEAICGYRLGNRRPLGKCRARGLFRDQEATPRISVLVPRKTGKRIGVDVATRMLE
jgi:hypothetical protein